MTKNDAKVQCPNRLIHGWGLILARLLTLNHDHPNLFDQSALQHCSFRFVLYYKRGGQPIPIYVCGEESKEKMLHPSSP